MDHFFCNQITLQRAKLRPSLMLHTYFDEIENPSRIQGRFEETNSGTQVTLSVYHFQPPPPGNLGWIVNGMAILACPTGKFPK